MKRGLLCLAMAGTFAAGTLALAAPAGLLDTREGRIVIGVAVGVALLCVVRFTRSANGWLNQALASARSTRSGPRQP
ncbi:hypothetical protein [Comamonas serinivorans]|uniref:hypothetical protein n=1 Tax=Comamonas serinivorans TaxID=1082851 RepID=UPI0012FBD7EC|nr:hypothetical protein [Comamonas serinivorans]